MQRAEVDLVVSKCPDGTFSVTMTMHGFTTAEKACAVRDGVQMALTDYVVNIGGVMGDWQEGRKQ